MYKIQYTFKEKEGEYLQSVLNRRHTKHSHRLCCDFTLRSLSTSYFLTWHVSITSSVIFAMLGQKMATAQLDCVTLNACSTYTVYCPYTRRCCWSFPLRGVILFCHPDGFNPFIFCAPERCMLPFWTQESGGAAESGSAGGWQEHAG